MILFATEIKEPLPTIQTVLNDSCGDAYVISCWGGPVSETVRYPGGQLSSTPKFPNQNAQCIYHLVTALKEEFKAEEEKMRALQGNTNISLCSLENKVMQKVQKMCNEMLARQEKTEAVLAEQLSGAIREKDAEIKALKEQLDLIMRILQSNGMTLQGAAS